MNCNTDIDLSKITIRAYHHSDKNKVIQLLKLNTPTYFSPSEEKDFSDYLDNEIEQYFVVEIEKQIIGSGGINLPNNQSIGVISWGMIHPDFQGQSIGKQLLNHRIQVLKLIPSVKQIIVRTSQHVFPFYEKCGFEITEIIDNYWSEGFHLYKMKYRNND